VYCVDITRKIQYFTLFRNRYKIEGTQACCACQEETGSANTYSLGGCKDAEEGGHLVDELSGMIISVLNRRCPGAGGVGALRSDPREAVGITKSFKNILESHLCYQYHYQVSKFESNPSTRFNLVAEMTVRPLGAQDPIIAQK
jgi:hypothetical protein